MKLNSFLKGNRLLAGSNLKLYVPFKYLYLEYNNQYLKNRCGQN